jgi:hypothetical protein
MSDLFTAPEPAAGAPRPKRPSKTRKAGLPPLSGAWYGPQEQVWLIPNPHLPEQPYRIQLSLITGVSRSAYATCCFLRMQGVQEPLLVGVSEETILEHAPWAADKHPLVYPDRWEEMPALDALDPLDPPVQRPRPSEGRRSALGLRRTTGNVIHLRRR